jgi:hypothetical protein
MIPHVHSKRIERLAERLAVRWQQEGDSAPWPELLERATQVEVGKRQRRHQRHHRIRQIAADLRRADPVSSDGALLALAKKMAKENNR